jgi:DNA-binding transcriptional regulator GbsR (MarR family)
LYPKKESGLLMLCAFKKQLLITKQRVKIKRMNENLNEQLDFMETCKEVKNQLSSIEKAMTAYNAKLALSKKNLESINNYKDYINAYLLENCK